MTSILLDGFELSKSKQSPLTYVYFIGSVGGPIKIGTSGSPIKRLNELQVGHAFQLQIFAQVHGGRDQELLLHQRFAASRLRGEWFSPTPDLLDFVWKCARIADAKTLPLRVWNDLGIDDTCDALGRFLAECVVADPRSRVRSSDLNDLFRAWAHATGGPNWHPKQFKRMMNLRGYQSKQSNGIQWLGLRTIKQVADFGPNR